MSSSMDLKKFSGSIRRAAAAAAPEPTEIIEGFRFVLTELRLVRQAVASSSFAKRNAFLGTTTRVVAGAGVTLPLSKTKHDPPFEGATMRKVHSWSSNHLATSDHASRANSLEERSWRRPERATSQAQEISISRWLDSRSEARTEQAVTPPDRYFIGIALKSTRLKLTGESQAIFEGAMPEGTLYVSGPSKRLTARFEAPCDFLHFHVPIAYFETRQAVEQLAQAPDYNERVLLRDKLVRHLAKALIADEVPIDETYANCVGQTLVRRLSRLEPPHTTVSALPSWRLRRVENHVKQNVHQAIRLSDMARVAGLSRMHFAAQFRAATGYRPHEYLLQQRIEQAKSLLSETKKPLVEVALAVGFCTQAHFSTVFKDITGQTPARWRSAGRAGAQIIGQPDRLRFPEGRL